MRRDAGLLQSQQKKLHEMCRVFSVRKIRALTEGATADSNFQSRCVRPLFAPPLNCTSLPLLPRQSGGFMRERCSIGRLFFFWRLLVNGWRQLFICKTRSTGKQWPSRKSGRGAREIFTKPQAARAFSNHDFGKLAFPPRLLLAPIAYCR